MIVSFQVLNDHAQQVEGKNATLEYNTSET